MNKVHQGTNTNMCDYEMSEISENIGIEAYTKANARRHQLQLIHSHSQGIEKHVQQCTTT